MLLSAVDPISGLRLPSCGSSANIANGIQFQLPAATKTCQSGMAAARCRLASNRRLLNAASGLCVMPCDPLVKSRTTLALQDVGGTSGSSCDEEPPTSGDFTTSVPKTVSTVHRRRQRQQATSVGSKSAVGAAASVCTATNLEPFSLPPSRRPSEESRQRLGGKSLTTIGFNSASDNGGAIGNSSIPPSLITGNARCSSSRTDDIVDISDERKHRKQLNASPSFGGGIAVAGGGLGVWRQQSTVPDTPKRPLERPNAFTSAAAALTGRQFQTIASRLQLAVVRPPADLSLLIRLT